MSHNVDMPHRRLVNVLDTIPAPPVDRHDDVRFRGKPLDSLTRDEAIEALRQALTELKQLNSRHF